MNCSTICSSGNHEGDLRMFRGRVQITSNCADENLNSKIRSFGFPCSRKRTLQITPNFCENKWKAVKMVVITTGAYFIIWFTYFVTYTFYAFSDDNCENLAYMIGRPMAMLGLINSLTNTSSLTSIFSIGLIAIDRYIYILYGLHYYRYITTRRSRLMVLLAWLISALFGFWPGFCWRSKMNGGSCCFISLIQPKLWVIVPSLGLIPMIIIVVLYGIILKNALNSRSRMKISSLENHDGDMRMFRGRENITSNYADDNLSSRVRSIGFLCCRISTLEITPLLCENKWKAVKIVVYTTGSYIITWCPIFVTCVLYAFCERNSSCPYCQHIAYLLRNPFSLLTPLNSLLNPVIYAWWHPGIRENIKKTYNMLLLKVFQKRKSSTCSETKIHSNSSIKQIGQENFDNGQELH
ncbi:glucose-dependent insulinotropic receptor-like [Episyrphus balteatus]|uniref:glucose-dependent insulinotropic receptor-like n=1 Tax=Episyrphus balteatus TaxID=286459 RepID=UPI00248657B3|nr:glucose-dependent insulinotropic receptor-like [Episyrphus balteatus]